MTQDGHFDFLVVGAGISGIGAAHHLQERHPGKSYLILEGRDRIGGTWDLFRYPGIRSDSDLHTFGYSFRPWLEERSIADASSILRYIDGTAAESGIDRHIRLNHRVRRASWSSAEQVWKVEVEDTLRGELRQLTAAWLICASGYYSYERPFMPDFKGAERFGGPIVHPQFWPEDLDWTQKRVVVIGSGATAVTLVPALAKSARHVTMLQRTPSYIISIPSVDPIAALLRRKLGAKRAHRLTREKNVRISTLFYKACRRYPEQMRKFIRAANVKALPKGFDVDRHFNPPYDPWDQRLCLVPDGDLFAALRKGSASVHTDEIETFTERGLLLASGEEIEADIIVTATGLELLAFGGMEIFVDGEELSLPDTYTYKGMMLTGVPNFVYVFGYTNASWTLRVDLVSEHLCRIISLMDEHGYGQCVPEAPEPGSMSRPLLDFAAGYVTRAVERFPRQGPGAPWELSMDYVRDRRAMSKGPVGERLRFTAAQPAPRESVLAPF